MFVSLSILSCRGDEVPEDIHEHEEIEKIVLTVNEKGSASGEQVINYIGGAADKMLVLENGKTYAVSLDFQHRHDDHYHSMLDEIIEEKDEHFVTFEFAGLTANVVRAGDDVVRTDGKKLGLKTEWTVSSVPNSAQVNIKLYHGATSVNDQFPSSDNQQGSAVGGEADVNTYFKIQ